MADIVTQEKSNLINDLSEKRKKKKTRPSQFCGTGAGMRHTQKLIVGHKELLDFKTKEKEGKMPFWRILLETESRDCIHMSKEEASLKGVVGLKGSGQNTDVSSSYPGIISDATQGQ